jgi:membrane-bound lytic murein transglycosylase D
MLRRTAGVTQQLGSRALGVRPQLTGTLRVGCLLLTVLWAAQGQAAEAAGARTGVVTSGQAHTNAAKPNTKAKSQAASSAQKKHVPKQPSATLPPGQARREPNIEARRVIAAGPTEDDRSVPPDAELQALQAAERVLFPRMLRGVRPGWSWDLPEPAIDNETPGGTLIVPPDHTIARADSTAIESVKWLRELSLPNLPLRYETSVVTYLRFYKDTPQGKALARTWAKKSGRYSKLITAEMARAGLPTDLLWQSVIESAHNPTARSAAGAVGLWQFLPATARLYGLTVDRWVDERLDPLRATEAACHFLSDLHQRFGNWDLSLAAYNMGHAGLGRVVRKYNSNDFWLLTHYEGALPWETSLYVPKILALAVVMANRSVFGIDDVEPEPAVEFDTISVGPGQPLALVAKAAGVPEQAVAELNPRFLAGRTPPSLPGQKSATYTVRIPVGTGPIAARKSLSLGAVDPDLESYVIRQGDTVESVAKATNATVPELHSINRLSANEVLVAGDLLLVPRRDRPVDVDIADDDRVVVVPKDAKLSPGQRRVFYRIVAGDTLSSIAKAFGVQRSDLLEWNRIDTTARLQAKMVLTVCVPADRKLQNVHYLGESEVRVLVAGSEQFVAYFEGLRGNDRVVVAARSGDTLASIAAKYGVNAATLERVNQRSRNQRLADGEAVIVYAPHGKVPKAARLAADALHPVQPAASTPAKAEPATREPPAGTGSLPAPDAG